MSDRPVSTDALETLGNIITDTEKRDAIHLAVIPTKAAVKLYPGQDVGNDGTPNNPIGIVDPFIKSPVLQDEYFWLVIYPREITSLRHVWSHPAFGDEPVTQPVAKPTDPVAISELWIKEFAASVPTTVHELMGAADSYIHNGEHLVQGGRFEGEHIPDEFWPHYETVTGTVVDESERGSFFSCSC